MLIKLLLIISIILIVCGFILHIIFDNVIFRLIILIGFICLSVTGILHMDNITKQKLDKFNIEINEKKEQEKLLIEELKIHQDTSIKYSELLKIDGFNKFKNNFIVDNNVNSNDEVIITFFAQNYDELSKLNIWGIVKLKENNK